MRYLIASAALSLAACASIPPAETVGPDPRLTAFPGFNVAETRADLIESARERYGDAALQRALAAPTHLITKHYVGLAPPPPPGAGPDWKPASPVALMYRDGGGWQFATGSGFRPAKTETAARIDSTLADSTFWAEPNPGPIGCTDAGGSLFLVKVPSRPEWVSRGVCGPAPLGEKLVFDAINS